MFCIKCGANIPDDSRFCPKCGTQPAQVSGGPGAPGPTPPPPAAPGATVRPPLPAPYASTSGFSPAPPAGYGGEAQTDGKAVGSLVLGILSITLLPILASIPAIILGHVSRSSIAKSMGRLKGQGMALAGLIMGYLSFAAIPFFLIFAAILIPNLLRARQSANESQAAQRIRTIVTSEMMYSTNNGAYSPTLGKLGLEGALNDPRCTAGTWCTADQYQYALSATATEFVVTATPINENAARRSFCATDDGVVRYQIGPVTEPLSVQACQAWIPI